MKRLALIAALVSTPALAQSPIYTPSGQVILSQTPRSLVFFNTNTGAGVSSYPNGSFVDIDVTKCVNANDPCVPTTAKGIILSSLLIISQGGSAYISDLAAYYKAPSSPDSCWNYLGQAVEADPASGVRSPWMTIVPIENGKIKFCRITLRAGSYYTPSIGDPLAFAVNTRVLGYLE